VRVCFASLELNRGCVDACRNAAAVLGGIWAAIPDDGALPAALLDAELAIVSSWHPRYEALLDRDLPVVPRWHSPLLQSELGEEGRKLARLVTLLDDGAIPALAVSDPALATLLARDGVIAFPEVLDLREYAGIAARRLHGTNVSLFGAAHPRKNLFVQAAAFEQVRRARGGDDWTLHLNAQSFLQPGALEWLDAARIPFVDHGRPERAEYFALVAAMDAGLCASLSEGYCYVAADHVALGVPVVASPTVACLFHGEEPSRLRPDDVGEVAAALAHALSKRTELALRQRETLIARAEENAALARTALAQLLSRTRRR
jgi:glycosyltransferase involved in cell wall biosynthesis